MIIITGVRNKRECSRKHTRAKRGSKESKWYEPRKRQRGVRALDYQRSDAILHLGTFSGHGMNPKRRLSSTSFGGENQQIRKKKMGKDGVDQPLLWQG